MVHFFDLVIFFSLNIFKDIAFYSEIYGLQNFGYSIIVFVP